MRPNDDFCGIVSEVATPPFHDNSLQTSNQDARQIPRPYVIESLVGAIGIAASVRAEVDHSLDEVHTYLDDGQVLVARPG